MVSFDPSLSALNSFATGVQGTAYNIANVNTASFQPVSVRYQSGRPADQGVHPVITRPAPDIVSGEQAAPFSHVDVAREMTNLITNQRAFEANATFIRTGDELLGVLVDLKV